MASQAAEKSQPALSSNTHIPSESGPAQRAGFLSILSQSFSTYICHTPLLLSADQISRLLSSQRGRGRPCSSHVYMLQLHPATEPDFPSLSLSYIWFLIAMREHLIDLAWIRCCSVHSAKHAVRMWLLETHSADQGHCPERSE